MELVRNGLLKFWTIINIRLHMKLIQEGITFHLWEGRIGCRYYVHEAVSQLLSINLLQCK